MKLFRARKPAVAVRGIHLDLKGLPPTPRRLVELLDLLAAVKINCVLVEWEDTYPWRRWPELRCETAYTRAAVRKFLARARELSIEVIPLVQSFGHMENVLSKKRFSRLRERADTASDLCPNHPDSRGIVLEMVEDLLETHGGHVTRLHLGGDEVWSLGSCPKCKKAVQKRGKPGLYLAHMLPLLDAVREWGLTPILWDDMMRGWPLGRLRGLASKANLMCWNYRPDPFEHLKRKYLDRYAAAGITLWGASAFKGADGTLADVCDPGARAANLEAWAAEAGRRELAGIVATGWSRYSTFVAPCESLEASLDSLVLAAASMWDGSLPAAPPERAVAFLRSARVRRIAGERFVRCRDASRSIADWKRELWRFLDRVRTLAHVVGEPGRPDARRAAALRGGYRSYVGQGRRICQAWTRAHSGLVPKVWLERYAASRIWLPRRLEEAVFSRIR